MSGRPHIYANRKSQGEENTVTRFSDYRRGIGLMTGFIAHFDTARDYTLTVLYFTHTLMPTVTSSLPLLGSGF
jgi:hypothetical protein